MQPRKEFVQYTAHSSACDFDQIEDAMNTLRLLWSERRARYMLTSHVIPLATQLPSWPSVVARGIVDIARIRGGRDDGKD